jgi:hypothetical protein
MVDVILLLMAIASALSLLVVSPRSKAIQALREYKGTELSRVSGDGDDGQTRIIPMNSDLLIVDSSIEKRPSGESNGL